MRKIANYLLNLVTPGGRCEVQADTMRDLSELVPCGLLGQTYPNTGPEEKDSLEAVAKSLLIKFLEDHKQKGSFGRSDIARAGFELDLVKCYLQDLTIEHTLKWLKDNRGFVSSKSSVGRYWTVLNKIGHEYKAMISHLRAD